MILVLNKEFSSTIRENFNNISRSNKKLPDELGRRLSKEDSPVLRALVQTYSTALELKQFDWVKGVQNWNSRSPWERIWYNVSVVKNEFKISFIKNFMALCIKNLLFFGYFFIWWFLSFRCWFSSTGTTCFVCLLKYCFEFSLNS